MTAPTLCTLPGGYLDEGGRLHREAELARLTGREEEWLVETAGDAAPTVVTRLLGACVPRIGGIAPVTPAVARGLLVADRQYLLLKLHETTFGGRVEGTLACPWPGCGAKVDIDFAVDAIPVKRADDLRARYPVQLSPAVGGEPARTLEFRLPTGDDQEALAATLERNPAEALTGLLARCLAPGIPRDEAAALAMGLSAGERQEVERAMEAAAPALDLDMQLACPECGRGFTAPFDIVDFFFGELRTSRDLLFRQVHYLAYHYHWSEQEIMEMERPRRLAYIDVLASEMEALNDAR